MEGGVCVCVKGLSSLPGCMLLSLALSSPIKPATPQQYGAINYRHAAINAERRGEERQEHINRTNGHIKDLQLHKVHKVVACLIDTHTPTVSPRSMSLHHI